MLREDSGGVRLVIVRADNGCYDHTLVEWLETQRARFVIVARLTAPITRKLVHLRYVSPSRGIEVAEYRYQPIRWPRPSRVVVARRPQSEEPNEQLTLFQLGTSHDQVLVTNLPLQPLNLWRFSNDRAGGSGSSNSSKGMTPSAASPTRHFMANETYFHLLLFADNLMDWFKRLCLRPEFQNATLQTLRHHILLLPAMLRRMDNRPCLA